MKLRTMLLIAFVAGFPVRPVFVPPAAAAGCVIQCMSHWFCSNPSGGHCAEEQSRQYGLCEIQCKGKSGNGWGAIAYSAKDKIWGSSYEQDYKGTAEQVAMQYCTRAHGAKCVVQATFLNSCGAIAADGDVIARGTAGSKVAAQQQALAECSRAGGKKCAVEASACSGAGSGSGSTAPSTPPPARTISWGALAYSSGDMGAGYSQGKNDRASAEKEAMEICTRRGKACVVRNAFNKSCGALAADRDFSGVGIAADQRESQQKAIAECTKAGGTRCVLHISFCSF